MIGIHGEMLQAISMLQGERLFCFCLRVLEFKLPFNHDFFSIYCFLTCRYRIHKILYFFFLKNLIRDFSTANMIGAKGLLGKSWPDLDMLPLGWLTDAGYKNFLVSVPSNI